MKTVCKKLLCLMLVAMMLVSAIPAAFANESTGVKVKLYPNYPQDAGMKEVYTKDDGTLDLDELTEAGIVLNQQWVNAANGEPVFGETEYTVTTMLAPQDKWLAVQEEDPAPCEHPESKCTTTNTATCGAAGTETVVCNACGETISEETAAATGNHNYVDGECTVCHNKRTYILTFYYLLEDGTRFGVEAEIKNDEKISLPTIPLVNGKDFLYWKDGKGNQITSNTVWNIGEDQTITAVYESNTTADGLVNLTVYANYYVEGEFHHRAKLYVETFEETKKNTMFEWLYSDAGKKATRDALANEGYEGYEWTQVKYYNYYGDGEITEADMKTDGNKTVYIKVYSTDEIEANVMLYVHTKETSTVDRVIPMPGYTEGDYVTYSEVKTAVKTKYSGSNMTISDLYTQEEWEDLLDGLKSSGAASVKVENNGTTKIHVIVKNATSSSNADTTNPKTGDYIIIAVTTMALSAAAVVTMVELKKRKMI